MMISKEHFEELEKEKKIIKWDIIGLSKTRLPGGKTKTLKSCYFLYQKNIDTNFYERNNGGNMLCSHLNANGRREAQTIII